MSIDNHCRQRGKDENDAPLLLDGEIVDDEADLVIGGELRDQSEGRAAEGLYPSEAIVTGAALGDWE